MNYRNNFQKFSFFRVPPASWHSFAKADAHVQSVLLAPYGKEYEYQRVNSILDKNEWTEDEREKAIQEIEAVSTAILAAAADYVGVETDEVVAKVDKKLVCILFFFNFKTFSDNLDVLLLNLKFAVFLNT